MRAVHEKPPDPHRRKGAAVFRQPVALRQSFLGDMDEPPARSSRRQRQPHLKRRIEHRRPRICLDPPQGAVGSGLEGADRGGNLVEQRRDGERRLDPLDFANNPQRAGHHPP